MVIVQMAGEISLVAEDEPPWRISHKNHQTAWGWLCVVDMKLSIVSSLLLTGCLATSSPKVKKDYCQAANFEDFKANPNPTWNAITTTRSKGAAPSNEKKAARLAKCYKKYTGADASGESKDHTKKNAFLDILIALHGTSGYDFIEVFYGRYFGVLKRNEAIRKFCERDSTSLFKAIELYINRGSKLPPPKLDAISPAYLDTIGKRLVDLLGTTTTSQVPNTLASMPVAFFSHLASLNGEYQKEICPGITSEHIKNMKPDLIKTFSSVCVASIPNIGTVQLSSSKIQAFSETAFEWYGSKFVKANVASLTRAQFKNFGRKLDPLVRGENVELSGAKSTGDYEAVRDVHADLLASYLLSKDAAALGKVWTGFASDIFKNLNSAFDVEKLVQAIKSSDKEFIPQALLNNIHKLKNAPANFTEGKMKSNSVIEIDPKDVPNLKDKKVLAYYLANKEDDMNPEILSYVSAEFFETVGYDTNGRRVEGILLLNKIQAPNKAEVIANLSSKIIGDKKHACSLISDATKFKALEESVVQSLSDACFAAISFDPSYEEILKTPALARGKDFEKTIAKFDDDALAKMPPAVMAAIVSGGCKDFTKEIFDKISKDAYSAVDGKCLKSLSFAKDLPKEVLGRFKATAFSEFDKDAWKNLGYSLSQLNDAQLGNLSADVKKTEDMVTSTFTEETIKSLGKRVQALTALQVSSFKKEVVAIIPLVDFKAATLRKLDADQIGSLIPKFGELTAEHVTEIGADHPNEKAIKEVMETNKAKLTKEALAAWEKRSPIKLDDESSIFGSMWTWIIIIVVVAIIVGGVIFFVRK